ncbi:MAG: 3-hydroxyacyl-ACP dehydratase FabZ family protein [Candidatus Promineifilaceae bacterium]
MRFLLVDRILTLERGRRAVGIKNIAMSEEYLAYHFPDRPIMPGMLIVEALVQLADWVVRENSDFTQLGMATAFSRLKFRRVARPGDQLRLEVDFVSLAEGAAEVKARALKGADLAASGSFTLALQPLEGYLAPAEARRLYALLTAPDQGNDGAQPAA